MEHPRHCYDSHYLSSCIVHNTQNEAHSLDPGPSPLTRTANDPLYGKVSTNLLSSFLQAKIFQFLSMSAPLDRLPPEIITQILYHIPNIPTLSAIVHASPIYHAVYISTPYLRERIFSEITVRDLRCRGLDLKKLIRPYGIMRGCRRRSPDACEECAKRFESWIWDYHRCVKKNEDVRMTLEQALNLRILWNIKVGQAWGFIHESRGPRVRALSLHSSRTDVDKPAACPGRIV